MLVHVYILKETKSQNKLQKEGSMHVICVNIHYYLEQKEIDTTFVEFKNYESIYNNK